MLYHNLICCFLEVFTLFYPKYELKSSTLVFLIKAPPQKLVLAPGATIRDNTVFVKNQFSSLFFKSLQLWVPVQIETDQLVMNIDVSARLVKIFPNSTTKRSCQQCLFFLFSVPMQS